MSLPALGRSGRTLAFILAISSLALGACAPQSPSEGRLTQVRSWAYQLSSYSVGEPLVRLADSNHDLLVIDQRRSLAGEEDFDDAAIVAHLKGSRGTSKGESRQVLCYLDVGQAESYRAYWQDDWRVGDPAWIVAADPDGWDENYVVAYWDPEWRELMYEAIDRVIADGYDGAYLDWLEVYDSPPVVSVAAAAGLDPEAEIVAFVIDLASYARSRDPDFILVAQNAAELGARPEWRALFDAVAQEAIWFDGAGDPDSAEQTGDAVQSPALTLEYLDALDVWRDAGIPVLDCEYAIEPHNVDLAYELGSDQGFITYVTTVPLDSLAATLPPPK